MPVTYRKALYGNLRSAIDYIINPLKTDGGILVSSQHCSIDFAAREIAMLHSHYGNKGNRTGYHVWQSFSPSENINPDQAHDLAIKLVKELYPNHQAVISTHIDRGHIHNHIIFSSLNLKTTRKLEDRLSSKGGLYALRETSDKIACEYGIDVLPKKVIHTYKTNTYINYVTKNWRNEIKRDIQDIINHGGISSYHELIDYLRNYGYEIKQGKYTSIKPIGKTRFVRLTERSMGDYSEAALKAWFRQNKYSSKNVFAPKRIKKWRGAGRIKNKLLLILGFNSLFIKSRVGLGHRYVKRYKLPKEYYSCLNRSQKHVNTLDNIYGLLLKEGINNFDMIEDKLDQYKDQLRIFEKRYEVQLTLNDKYQEGVRAVEIINEYSYLLGLKKEISILELKRFKGAYENEFKLLKEAENKIRDVFDYKSIDDLKFFTHKANTVKNETNKLLSQMEILKQKIEDLTTSKRVLSNMDSMLKESKDLLVEISLPLETAELRVYDDYYYSAMIIDGYECLISKEDSYLSNERIYFKDAYNKNFDKLDLTSIRELNKESGNKQIYGSFIDKKL